MRFQLDRGVQLRWLPEQIVPLAAAVKLARRCNEFAADMRNRFPGRFRNFAVLQTPFADLAATELEYALDTLQADGVVLPGSTDGVFPGDPRYDELMAELDRRPVTVFVHPNIHATSAQPGLGAPGFLVEFLCDATPAAVNPILTGTLENYPRIRWIPAQSGGFLPYVAWPYPIRRMPAGQLPNSVSPAALHRSRVVAL